MCEAIWSDWKFMAYCKRIRKLEDQKCEKVILLHRCCRLHFSPDLFDDNGEGVGLRHGEADVERCDGELGQRSWARRGGVKLELSDCTPRPISNTEIINLSFASIIQNSNSLELKPSLTIYWYFLGFSPLQKKITNGLLIIFVTCSWT